MLARKEQSGPPRHLPDTQRERLLATLQEAYAAHLASRRFEIFGLVWPDEFVLAVSLIGEGAPLTWLGSADSEQAMDGLLDCAGHFFDRHFQAPDEDPYRPHWQTGQGRGREFFERITREDVAATLAADRLLAT